MISFDEAVRRFLAVGADLAPALGVERAAIDAVFGRVLAEDLCAPADLPPFDHSAMDGYAVALASFVGDGPWTLPVLGESRTGGVREDLLPGCACRIFTGASIPGGADAVVIQEHVTRSGERATFEARPKVGAHIRRRGEDLARGAVAVAKGTRLRAAHVALAATCDRAWVDVARRPVVTILSTGDELRAPGTRAEDGGGTSIPESNGVALQMMSARAGAIARVAPIVPDDRAATERAIATAMDGCDVLVTVGGVGAGDHDWIHPALERNGVTLEVSRVAMKPGKPIVLGRNGRSIVLGLPGNPASAMITFALLGVPLLRALQGDVAPLAPRRRARCAGGIARAEAGRTELVRVRVSRGADGETWATPARNQASGATSSLADSDALLVVPDSATRIADGEPCDLFYLEDLGA
jgi:molybdopterin molybdotransferase